MTAVSLARVLLGARIADAATLGQASAIAAEGGVPLVYALVRWRLVDAGALAAALSRALQCSITSLAHVAAPPPVALPRSVCARLRVVALGRRDDVVALAMSDPTDDDAAQQVGAAFGVTVERHLVDDDELERALRRVYPRADELPSQPPEPTTTPDLPRAPPAALPRFRSVNAFADVAGNASSLSSSSPATPAPTASPPVEATAVGTLVGIDMSASSFAVSVADGAEGELPSEVFAGPSAPLVPSSPSPAAQMLRTQSAAGPWGQATRPADAGAAAEADDVTLPADVLSVMRLLVVADAAVARALVARLRPVLRELAVVQRLDEAQQLLASRPFHEVAVVDPPDTVAASQALALLASRQKRGALVVSSRADFARLPGVRFARCGAHDDVVGVITAALHTAARA